MSGSLDTSTVGSNCMIAWGKSTMPINRRSVSSAWIAPNPRTATRVSNGISIRGV